MPVKPDFINLPSNFQTNTNWLVTPSRYSHGEPISETKAKSKKISKQILMEQTTTPSHNLQYSLGEPSGDQNERQEKKLQSRVQSCIPSHVQSRSDRNASQSTEVRRAPLIYFQKMFFEKGLL